MPSPAISTFTNILYFPTVELIQNTPPTLILPYPLSSPPLNSYKHYYALLNAH